MKYSYKTNGTCARQIDFEVENGVVKEVSFQGGCNGNLKGISALCVGMNINDVIVSLTEYKIIESKESRWSALWVYKDVQYMLSITDIEQLEVEKIVNSLSFFE